ncbi:MAG: hypothetical protein ACRDK4_11000 [Solirubrobacteraceae bacterium]
MSTAFDPVRYKETTRDQWQAATEAWEEIESALGEFEGEDGFVGPCELLVATAIR